MSPDPCFSDTDCIALAFDGSGPGLTATPILDPDGGLECTPDGLGIAMHRYRAYRSAGGQVIATGGTFIAWDAEDYDAGFNIAPSSSLIVPADGLYVGVAQVKYDAQGDNENLRISFFVNGVDVAQQRLRAPFILNPSAQVKFMDVLSAGDIVRVEASFTTATVAISGSGNTWVSLTRLSA